MKTNYLVKLFVSLSIFSIYQIQNKQSECYSKNSIVNSETATVKEKKWFPGNYIMASENDFQCKSKGWEVIKGKNGDLFQGVYLYVTWSEIESSKNTYHWEKIDALLNALPKGKKLILSLAWQAWHGTNAPCPSDMIDDKNTGLYHLSYRSDKVH